MTIAIDANLAFGFAYCAYALLVAGLNTWPRITKLTRSNLFLLGEVTVGVATMGLHLWAVQGAEVFLAFLKICIIAGGPMALAMVAVELVRHARESHGPDAERKAAQIRGEL